jgi:hypothetical protein
MTRTAVDVVAILAAVRGALEAAQLSDHLRRNVEHVARAVSDFTVADLRIHTHLLRHGVLHRLAHGPTVLEELAARLRVVALLLVHVALREHRRLSRRFAATTGCTERSYTRKHERTGQVHNS